MDADAAGATVTVTAVSQIPTGDQRGDQRSAVPTIGQSVRLGDPQSGNLCTMAWSGYRVPRHGSTVQQMPAPRLALTVPATVANVTALRRTFRRWVGDFVDDETADDLTLAVYEALINAAEHAFAAPRAAGSVWLCATVVDGQISVTVTDNGTWRRPTDSGGYRGRGLPLIHQLTTEAYIAPSPHGTTVHFRRQIRVEQYAGSA